MNKIQRLRRLEISEIKSILENNSFSVMYENENGIDWFYANNSDLEGLHLVGFVEKQTNKMSGNYWINAIIWSRYKNLRLRLGDSPNLNNKEFFNSLTRNLSITINKDVDGYEGNKHNVFNNF